MKQALVSIVVSVYNVEKYIDECIKSLANQTYPEIEILLIDDGSTDNSGQKCNQWAEKKGIITAFHKKNEGAGFTRNYGMERTRGRWIVFVDSDDYVQHSMIERMMEEQKKHNADTVVAGWHRVDRGVKWSVFRSMLLRYMRERITNISSYQGLLEACQIVKMVCFRRCGGNCTQWKLFANMI